MARAKDKRIKFIDEVKDHIAAACPPGMQQAARAAIKKWEDGGSPQTPVEHGVFSMCAQVRDSMEEQG